MSGVVISDNKFGTSPDAHIDNVMYNGIAGMWLGSGGVRSWNGHDNQIMPPARGVTITNNNDSYEVQYYTHGITATWGYETTVTGNAMNAANNVGTNLCGNVHKDIVHDLVLGDNSTVTPVSGQSSQVQSNVYPAGGCVGHDGSSSDKMSSWHR